MADKERSALGTLLAFAIIIGLLIWAGMVVSSQGEKRLENACKPVEYTTNFLHDLATSVMGRQPTWTLYTQQYLMNGCTYAFSVVFHKAETPGETPGSISVKEEQPATGGIQQK